MLRFDMNVRAEIQRKFNVEVSGKKELRQKELGLKNRMLQKTKWRKAGDEELTSRGIGSSGLPALGTRSTAHRVAVQRPPRAET